MAQSKTSGVLQRALLVCVALLLCLGGPALAADVKPGPLPDDVLAGVLERGYVRCGVNDLPGYAEVADDGMWRGFQVDLCRAIAAAVLDAPEAVEFSQLYTDDRFSALEANEVDVILSNASWTLSRETGRGIAFTTTMEYDGQGFMAYADLGLKRLADAAGRNLRVCVVSATTTENNLRDYLTQHDLGLEMRSFETHDAQWRAFLDNLCDITTGDRTSLYISRASRSPSPASFVVLPDIISREPLTPVVRKGAPTWESLVRWVMHSLVIAEEKGITKANVLAQAATATDPELRKLLGTAEQPVFFPGVDARFALRAIAAVGNYHEIFDRNLGKSSPFGMDRGLNALWKDGGLLYAPLFQ
ncbi:amino acid ABC transporter substrate-binding protein [Megalodesulfovibrio gigas]|uniref:Putative Lysine-arginine-ornithine-binding periplasmic protein n=1 Tax=Megalodesulfovibrio gigas (strain ATCC 19364 / DSM 1382 / NCIMB 9332 / VKM B-1759) TaxID=1121448 RepID=T2G791_MEGG1|nr:amino acid ABC transporter substrate-binding protein [Megalodesulfovibrio gigas]AGW12006.1 putative Lysine-arginine-ornithine-binding periplasmic protein [Megalodesulfovibrio gigas DSM 1382 = ATCC 19364]